MADPDFIPVQKEPDFIPVNSAPNAGLAPPAGPSRKMDSGEGPIASELTSFETQLGNMPRSIGRSIKSSWMDKPVSDERAGTSADSFVDPRNWNPIVKTDPGTPNEHIDIGATGANLLPLAVSGEGIAESPIGKGIRTAGPPIVRTAARGANMALEHAPAAIGSAAGYAVGQEFGHPVLGAGAGAALGRKLIPQLRVPGENFGIPKPSYPGAPFPEAPPQPIEGEYVPDKETASPIAKPPTADAQVVTPKMLPASASVSRDLPYRKIGGIEPEDVNVPNSRVLGGRRGVIVTMPSSGGTRGLLGPGEEAKPNVEPPVIQRPTLNIDNAPKTLSGDSALRQILTGQDNQALLKIAKSRGINITKEAQLKPGVGDKLLVDKIINDFSPEELEGIRSQYLENNRFRHEFGDIGSEAWKTMSLQSYFPDLKIPATRLARTQKAIANPASDDLTPELEKSVAAARARKTARQ